MRCDRGWLVEFGRKREHRPPPRRDPFVGPGVMSTPHTGPAGPGRRPYGTVRLAAPVVAAPPSRRPVRVAPGRWYGPRPPLPPLSLAALRRGP